MKNAVFALLFKYALLFSLGGAGYYLIEVLYRGYSHISMALCGGFCLCAIYEIYSRLEDLNIFARALLGALVITLAELFTGCIVNIALGLDVWSYSHLPLNLWGQICLPLSAVWYLFSLALSPLCRLLKRRVFSAPLFSSSLAK